MDPSSTVARAQAEIDELTLAPTHPNLANGQNFSNIFAHDSSRLHLGDNYYVTYSCAARHELTRRLSSDTSSSEHSARTTQERKRHVEDAIHGASGRYTLATVLENLGRYEKSMQQLNEGSEWKLIASQLEVILASLGENAGHDECASGNLDDQLQILRDYPKRTRRIKVNGASPQPLLSRAPKAHGKSFDLIFGNWTISLSIKTLTSQSTRGQTCMETCFALRVWHRSRGSPVSAFLGERDDIDHFTTMSPVLMAYNQVGSDAEVFDLVKGNALTDFLRLLAIGEASIRDCDEDGRSLLFVSALPMCHDPS